MIEKLWTSPVSARRLRREAGLRNDDPPSAFDAKPGPDGPTEDGATRDSAAADSGGVWGQLFFRRLNEQIRLLADGLGLDAEFDLVCECTDGDCFEGLTVSAEDYEGIRRFPTRFVAKPGHAADQVERVVEETASFLVVEKIGADAQTAIRFDARRRVGRRAEGG
jgi:hypothetical protein